MSTDDDRRVSALTGEALLAGRDDRLRSLLERPAEATDSPEVRAVVAGACAEE
jgi:hypothetical protein